MPKDACEPVSGIMSPRRAANGSGGDSGDLSGSGVGVDSILLGVEACGGAATCWGEAGACGGCSAASGGEAAACEGEAAGSGGGTGACSGRTGACRRAEDCCAVEGCWGACSRGTRCFSATGSCSAGAAGFLLQPVRARATLKSTDDRKVRATGRSLGQQWAGATELCGSGSAGGATKVHFRFELSLIRLAHLIGNPDVALSLG
jgi:hypothetical protein